MAAETDLACLEGAPVELQSSIFSHLEEGLKLNPNGPAAIVMHQRWDHLAELTADHGQDQETPDSSRSCLVWTYAQLHRAALRLAAGLAHHGIRPGMRLATLIPNRVEYLLVLWTCHLARLTLCGLDPNMTNKPRRAELESIMKTLEPDAIMALGSEAMHAATAALAAGQLPRAKASIVLEFECAQSGSGIVSIPQLLADGLKHPLDEGELLHHARNDDPNRIAQILFTSGTSAGKPKGCPRHVGAIGHILAVQEWGTGSHKSTRALFSTANFRVIAPALTLHVGKSGGAVVMAGPSFNPGQIGKAVDQFRLTYIGTDFSSVESVTWGGDMITKDFLAKVARSFPNAKINNTCGMTEGAGAFRWCFFHTEWEDLPNYQNITPLGKVADGVRVQIRNPDTGATKKKGESGEVCLSGEGFIKHYIDHAHEDSFFHDGERRWFKSGDLGMIDQNDVVVILGRVKDVIKRSGIPITPAAMENCIEQLVDSQTVVLGYPHSILGQEPFAVLKSLRGHTPQAIKERVVSMFGLDYALGEVVSLKQLGLQDYPLNPTGKVMKIEVLKSLQELVGAR